MKLLDINIYLYEREHDLFLTIINLIVLRIINLLI